MLAAIWVTAIVVAKWSMIPVYGAAGLTVIAVGVGIWAVRYVNKSRELGALLRSASETEEGRKEALRKLETDYKKGDVQAVMARAQLEMQDDPRKALETLESVELAKQIGACGRPGALHAGDHPPSAGRAVGGEGAGREDGASASSRSRRRGRCSRPWRERRGGGLGRRRRRWSCSRCSTRRTPSLGEMRVQMWRARAFAYAGAGDMKAASRALKKLLDMSPQLLGMFVGAKKVHPMLQQEAKQILMRSGAVPRKMVRQKM